MLQIRRGKRDILGIIFHILLRNIRCDPSLEPSHQDGSNEGGGGGGGGGSGGAKVLGKLPVPGRPTIWMIVGQGPIALAAGAGGGCLDIFTLLYPFFSFSLSLGDDPI